MFSEPGQDQLPPTLGAIGTEISLDDIRPSDGRQSSNDVAELRLPESLIPVKFTESTKNVSSTPTDEELTEAFGNKAIGEAFIIRDGGGAGTIMLIVKGGQDTWWYEILTKAL